MSRSSAIKRGPIGSAVAASAATQQSWVARDSAHDLENDLEGDLEGDLDFDDGELELDDCGPEPGDHDSPFADEHYPELAPEQQHALRVELQDRLSAYLSEGQARVVITDNLRTMISIKRGHGVYTFRLHHMFIDAPPMVLRAIVAYAERQDRDASDLLRTFIDANEDAIREHSEPRAVTVDVQGRHHDLQSIFDELNARYFAGSIKARISWGSRIKRKRGRSSIKLGSYTVEDELIRVHPVLDAVDVPRYYLAWVVYHEMLHEIHDMPVVDGRRVYHTRAFRAAEAKFEEYAVAVLWERQNLNKLLDR